uniref:Putative secreted protein n=1 Tax=Amblyomma triste TaxID=251400 RepID=A0A023G467_AMBTT
MKPYWLSLSSWPLLRLVLPLRNFMGLSKMITAFLFPLVRAVFGVVVQNRVACANLTKPSSVRIGAASVHSVSTAGRGKASLTQLNSGGEKSCSHLFVSSFSYLLQTTGF